MDDMTKDFIKMIAVVTTLFVLFAFFAVALSVYVGQFKYGSKTIHCVEDNGAEWNATISNKWYDIGIYLNGRDGLRFMSEDGRIMQCRGSYDEIKREIK